MDNPQKIDLDKLLQPDSHSATPADNAAFRIAVFINRILDELVADFSNFTSIDEDSVPAKLKMRGEGLANTFDAAMVTLSKMPCVNSMEILLQLLELSLPSKAVGIMAVIGDLAENSTKLDIRG